MNTKLDLEDQFVQDAVRDVVRVGLLSPLRDPILEAVEDVTGEPVAPTDEEGAADEGTADSSDSGGKSALTKAVQGLIVFVVMFSVLYLTFQRFTGDDSS